MQLHQNHSIKRADVAWRGYERAIWGKNVINSFLYLLAFLQPKSLVLICLVRFSNKERTNFSSIIYKYIHIILSSRKSHVH